MGKGFSKKEHPALGHEGEVRQVKKGDLEEVRQKARCRRREKQAGPSCAISRSWSFI